MCIVSVCCLFYIFFFFKQKTAYEMRISDWSSDVCSSDLLVRAYARLVAGMAARFRNYGLPTGDLLQEGNVGLLQAASRFEPERGEIGRASCRERVCRYV